MMRNVFSARLRRRAAAWGTAAVGVGLVVGLTASPAAAIAELPDVFDTVTVEACGAEATVKVFWESATSVSLRWTVRDTKSDSKSPVLRMFASNPSEVDPAYTFSGGSTSYVFTGGSGESASGGMNDWNPDGFGDINNLEITLQNGTADQGAACATVTTRVYNFGRLAVREAKKHVGQSYVYGAAGPTTFDCSGLTLYSFNKIPGFSGMPRTSADQLAWAKRNGKTVTLSNAQPGDLLFWPGHVGFYYGGGKVLDAGNPAVDVSIRNVWGSPTVVRVLHD